MKKLNLFFKKLNTKDRFQIMFGILVFMIMILSFRLFYLTLIEGDYYEDISKNNRIKDIILKAPRGNIYDRNGQILATNRMSFTASIYKDDFNLQNQEKKNEELLSLTRILEQEGAPFVDNYPLELNMLKYKNDDDYSAEELTPEEKLLKIVRDNDYAIDLLKLSMEDKTEKGNYRFDMVTRAVHALKSKGILLNIEKKDQNYIFSNDELTKETLKAHGFKQNDNVYDVINRMMMNDDSTLRKVLNHPAARKIAFEFLSDHHVEQNLGLDQIGLLDKKKFIEQKTKLHKTYPEITLDSDPIDDFVVIVEKNTLKKFLERAKFDANNRLVAPAKKAIELLESKGIKNYKYDIDESDASNLKAVIQYKTQEELKLAPIDKMIDDLKTQNLLKTLITDDQYKYLAQQINTEDNINPGISISDWKYTSIKNFEDFYKKMGFKEKPENQEIYDKTIEKYKLQDYGLYDRFNILACYDRLEKQGARRYEALNLAYNLSEKGVARIEEGFENSTGIKVMSVPIRYYPNGELASHVIGYLGKISTEDEKSEYIDNKGYKTDDLIGKTGIENSQETVLVGKDGYQSVLVDARGNRTDILKQVEAKAGNSLYLSIDLDIQKATENALKKTLHSLQTGDIYTSVWGNKRLTGRPEGGNYSNATSAATVVMDVKTGEILALASVPSFDPNLFATGISSSDWESLFPKDEKNPLAPRPLYNIALQSAIQPGSTFKLNSSLAALEKGIDPNMTIKCNGYVQVGDKTFGCWIWNLYRGTHGYESVREALRDSCNYYFYSLVLGKNPRTNQQFNVKLDIEDILKTARKLGLGKKTGVEITMPREVNGTLPDPLIKLSNAKVIFSRFLEKNIEQCQKKGVNKSEADIKKDIETIVTWMDGQNKITRTEIQSRLDQLGYDGEQKISDHKDVAFGDIIKYDYLDQAHWTIADTLNVVIGQGQNAYTPLQMARYMCVFANDGYMVKPTLIDKINSPDNKTTYYENKPSSDRIELENYDNLRIIREGTEMAASAGSDHTVFNKLPIKIGVKSGTAEVDGKNPVTGKNYDNYAWMIGFAPYDNPKIAIATVIIQGGGSANCAPLTRDIIAQALKLTPGKQMNNSSEEAPNTQYEQ